MLNAPDKCRDFPPEVQRAYVSEFMRVFEAGDSALAAAQSADQVLDHYRRLTATPPTHAERPVLIEAHVAELAAFSSIESIVPEKILDEIRAVCEKPYFVLFEVATEGESIGGGQKKVWPFRAIKELADRIREKAGKLWAGHDGKDDPGRKSLGNVIWGFAKRAGKVLKAYAVAHVTDDVTIEKIESGEYDCCSIEGVADFVEADGKWRIESVKSIDGLALANSAKQAPGFRTAGAIAAIQELEEGSKNVAEQVINISEKITKYDILPAIERLGLKPTDVFREADILGLDAVKKATEEAKKQAEQAMQVKLDAMEKELSPLKAKALQEQIADQVGKSALLTDASPKVREFVIGNVKRMDLSGLDEKERAAKIEDGIKAQLDTIKQYNIKFEDAPATDDGGKDGKTGDGEPKPPKKSDPNDLTDPKNNPFIPVEDE